MLHPVHVDVDGVIRVRRVRACGNQDSLTMHHRSQACFRVLSSSVFGALCNVQGVCRELLTTTDANRDRVIEYDELVVPVATKILMEILMATQLKRASQLVCRHQLGRVKPALCCLTRWPSVLWCCVMCICRLFALSCWLHVGLP